MSALLLAAIKVCVVYSQYFRGINPSFMQLRSAPLSTSAIKSCKYNSLLMSKLIFIYHFGLLLNPLFVGIDRLG